MGCDTKHPLIRDGVSQKQRLPVALDPSYAQVDERSMEDLLYFLVNYAKEVTFYDTDNNLAGDWKLFLEKDITVIISLIAKKDASIEKAIYNFLINEIEDNSSSNLEIRKAFKTLFDLLFSIIWEFDKWYTQTSNGLGIQTYLKRHIRSQVKPSLEKLISYYKGAQINPKLFNTDYDPVVVTEKYELGDAKDITEKGLLDVWYTSDIEGKGFDDWGSYYSSIPEDTSIYGNTSVAAKKRIRNSLNQFDILFTDLYKALVQVIDHAPKYVEETLDQFSSHEPHMGLILSFLQLFKHVQDHLNTITKRHLDFYYEHVLQLARLDAVPDKVHLIFELAKHIETHKLEEGTLLKGGKDALGNEVSYETTDETVYNKASIGHLKSLFIDNDKPDVEKWQVYASPVANSSDGIGEEFEEEDASWKAFGEAQKDYSTSERTMPDADIGFAISSPNLLMKEGYRTLLIGIECVDVFSGGAADISDMTEIYLTGEKGWITKTDYPDIYYYMSAGGNIAGLFISLDPSIPAIVNYDSKIHGGNFDTKYPMMKIKAKRGYTGDHMYNMLHEAKIKSLTVIGLAGGLKNLVLQNDNGVLDPSKPFQPFGATPVKGSSFYVGSYETFKKDLSWLFISVKWHNIPADADGDSIKKLDDYYNHNDLSNTTIATSYDPANSEFKARFEILNDYAWSDLLSTTDNLTIFNDNDISAIKYFSFTDANSNIAIPGEPDLEEFSDYNISSKRGFIRLILDEPNAAFGHNHYASLYAQVIVSNPLTAVDLPVEPYTPAISSIELAYVFSETIDLSTTTNFDKRTSKLFHIMPFGQQEVHKKLTGDDLYLLPQFKHTDESGVELIHQGEFYVGLKDLDPPQNISLLFKVSEGSANPALPVQEINWFYLENDKWIEFNYDEILTDTTNGLLTSGIIKFSIPRTATDNNTIMDSGYHWIMASVTKNTNAICDLVAVYVQAGTASFKDNNNDPTFLDSVLPAKTISKLKVKEAEVKTITQPYASFGGKVKESDKEFYRRISERLRHKERGISIWDYERLILQEFPEVYKAKCISHSIYDLLVYDADKDETKTINSEFAPGYITVIVVPELKNQNAVDPLKPRVSLNTLDEIKEFLNQYNSPFAAEKLKVINPLFESIRVNFYVEFHSSYDRGYYEKQLIQDIIEFLSPWAFDKGKDIVFGGKIHRSVILNFIEEREYVDYLTDFTMDHLIDDTTQYLNVEEAIATTARSVLVSNDTHVIKTTTSCS